EQLENIDPPSFGYKGRTYTHYQALQQQRKIETAIRQTKREIIAYKNAGLEEDFTSASIKLNRQKQEYKNFSRVAGLLKRNERHQVQDFDKSISQKSVWSNKKNK
ncbi:phage minor capsid protein, partial [Clostridioides difficile]